VIKHAGIVKVKIELLAQLLGLPEDAQITGIYQTPADHLHEQFSVKIRHPNMPVVAEGAEIPEVDIESIRGEP
jgi:hypothetical protein